MTGKDLVYENDHMHTPVLICYMHVHYTHTYIDQLRVEDLLNRLTTSNYAEEHLTCNTFVCLSCYHSTLQYNILTNDIENTKSFNFDSMCMCVTVCACVCNGTCVYVRVSVCKMHVHKNIS